ncbi:MAG: ABC transporter ATP-binding protein, partial [Porticoccus sp.]
TNGPAATIGEILDVKLPRPRDRLALAEDPDFIHYRQQVLKFLYEKQKNPASPLSINSSSKNGETEHSSVTADAA